MTANGMWRLSKFIIIYSMTFRPRFQESSSANPKQLSVLSRGKVDCTEAILCMMMTNNDPVIIILSGRPKHSVVMWRYVIVWRRRFDTLWYCSDVGIESLWNLREFYESFEFTLDSTLGKYFHPPDDESLQEGLGEIVRFSLRRALATARFVSSLLLHGDACGQRAIDASHKKIFAAWERASDNPSRNTTFFAG